jgi:hypothetical protein
MSLILSGDSPKISADSTGVLTSRTAVASTSGTSIDFTGIPSWVKRITLMLNGVSTNGSSNIQVQLGDSGGIETSGYSGAVSRDETLILAFSTGFTIEYNRSAALSHITPLIFNLVTGNTWMCSFIGVRSDTAMAFGAGTKTLSDVLTQVRITTVNGTDVFDAGSINILYE